MKTQIITWAIIAFCILVTLSTRLQRAVLTFLQAGIIVLALYSFVRVERETSASRQSPPIGETQTRLVP